MTTNFDVTTNTTTTSNSDALKQFNDSVDASVASGVTVDGFGLQISSTSAGSTITFTNDGTVTTNQTTGNRALLIDPGAAGDFGTLTYSGAGDVTNTGTGGALLIDNQGTAAGTGNIDITISGTSTITGAPGVPGPGGSPVSGGNGIEASTNGNGTVTITVDTGGLVEGQGGVSFGFGVNTLDNSGTVQGTGALSFGVSGQVATVVNSGTISGSVTGVGVEDVTLTNNAMIETTGTTADDATLAAVVAVDALAAGNITNNAGATIQATGPFGQVGVLIGEADGTGAPIATGNATVDNAGTISGPFDAVNTSTTGTTKITNSGSITATTRSGIRVDTATIENDKGGTISGLNGIFFRNDPTAGQVFAASSVFNDGTITGTGSASVTPVAIHFSSGSVDNTLTLGTDSVINGNVLGAGSDTLQLGGTGSASFDVSNIGAAAQYRGFSTFNKIDTSTWTLTGTDTDGWTVEQGTLQVDGTIGGASVDSGGILDGTGSTGAVTVASGGTLSPGDAPGTINTGDLDLEAGSTLSIGIEGTSPGAGGFAQVGVTGGVTLGGTLSTSLLNGFTPGRGASFEIIANDGNDPVSGTFAGLPEGALLTTGSSTLSISYVGGTGNDVVLTDLGSPPSIALGTTVAAWTEEQAVPTSLAPAATVSDANSATLASATVQISGGTFAGDSDVLAATTTGTSITAVYNSATETLTLTGSGTLADYQTVLNTVTFNAGENPTDFGSDPTRTLTWLLNDGTTSSNSAISTISLTSVNDPPTLALGATTAAWTEEQASPTTLSPSLTVTDADDLDLVSATVSITGGSFTGDSLRLSGQTSGTIIAGTNITPTFAGNGLVTLSGSDTLAAYQSALELVTFNGGENPTDFGADPTRTLTWTLNDGSGTANGGSQVGSTTSTISITNVNDSPILSVGSSNLQYTEEGAAAFISSSLTVTDPDDVDLSSATVKITGGAVPGDTLSFKGTVTNGTLGAISLSYDSSSETLTLTGNDTLQNYQTTLEDILFSAGENPTNFGSNPTRTITWQVQDPSGTANGGADTSTLATTTLTITNVNDPPTLSNVATLVNVPFGATITVSPAVSVSDPDNLSLAGATLHITAGTFAGDGDVLAISGATSGTVGAISFSYDSSTETLTLTGTDTLAHYQSALDSVTFDSTSPDPTNSASDPTRMLTWVVNDGSASNNFSTAATTTIHVTGVNEAPSLTNVAPTAFYTEEGAPTTLSGSASVSDPDDIDLSSATVQITGGTFANDGDVLSANTAGTGITAAYNSATETLTLSGADSLANYQQVLDSVTFSAGENPTNFGSNATRTVTWTLMDPSGTANGGVNVSKPVISTVSITNVNDAPTLSNVAIAANVAFTGETITISPALSVSDPDNLTLAGATVAITGGTFAGDGDVLAIGGATSGTVGVISFSYNSSTETLTLTGSDTLAHYQSALDSVTFDSTSPNPTNSGSDPTRTLTWVLNDGSASNNLSTAATTTIRFAGEVKNDFDGDGKSDVLLQNNDGLPVIWELNNTTITGGGALPDPGAPWHIEATADFNHDGRADIILQNTDGLPVIWEMNGTSIIGAGALPDPGPSWHVIATGDFNADGNPDILWQNTDGAAVIWEMNGTSIIGGGALPDPGSTWHAIGTGDFNGDGKSDVLWQNADGLVAIWEMNGTSIAGSGAVANPGGSWHAIATGDFNGDGRSDILLQNTDALPVIWEMNGTSIVGGGALPDPGPGWHAIGTSDFNGDGKADILWQNTDGLPVTWDMNGTSIITSAGGKLANPGPTWHVKDDGPIPFDQMASASTPQQPALQLSAPDTANVTARLSAPGGANNTSSGAQPPSIAGFNVSLPAGVAPLVAAASSLLGDASEQSWLRQIVSGTG